MPWIIFDRGYTPYQGKPCFNTNSCPISQKLNGFHCFVSFPYLKRSMVMPSREFFCIVRIFCWSRKKQMYQGMVWTRKSLCKGKRMLAYVQLSITAELGVWNLQKKYYALRKQPSLVNGVRSYFVQCSSIFCFLASSFAEFLIINIQQKTIGKKKSEILFASLLMTQSF